MFEAKGFSFGLVLFSLRLGTWSSQETEGMGKERKVKKLLALKDRWTWVPF